MFDAVPIVLAPVLVAVVASFLIYRFGFFTGRDVSGRLVFVAGSLLLLLATAYEVVELVPDYSEWFVPGAYAAIDFSQFLVGALGLLMIVVGLALYTDYWQTRREETDERFSKLSILENLQHDSRQPYHLLELLNMSLREILVHYPLSAGAVFLVNRTRRQFVLTGSSGLRKDEVAYLEYYPLERNAVSQAVDLGDPMLVSRFDFIDRSGRQISSRFRNVLILPLASGMEKIGCLLLFNEETEFFGREDIRYLSPVAQWLAEKIRSARLARELSQVTGQRDEQAANETALIERLSAAAQAGVAANSVDGFCQALIGLAGSESVHLCRVNNGALAFVGGSEPLFELSENFRAALIDGMARTRPLIINQESTGADGSAGVVQSNLIYPVSESKTGPTLLFIRSGRPFEVSDTILRTIEGFAHLARLVLQSDAREQSRLTRRKGLDAVLRLLQNGGGQDNGADDLAEFARTLQAALPRNSRCLILSRIDDATYGPVQATGTDDLLEQASDLRIPVEEGGLGAVLGSGESLFIFGRAQVARHLEAYHDQVRADLQPMFGEAGTPDLLVYCPVPSTKPDPSVVLAVLYGLSDSDRGEWERLITLASGLYGLRSMVAEISARAKQPAVADQVSQSTRPPLSAELHTPVPADSIHLDRLVGSELQNLHVSGDVYMVGQRPREIRLRLSPAGALNLSSQTLTDLFHSVLNRFGSLVDDTDLVTIATYVRDGYAFLDICRHRPNFPPVDEVAGFGRYGLASETFRNRPADIYLRHLGETVSYYAVDTASAVPAFLSFKFPLKPVGPQVSSSARSPIRLLAIDDQPVILDLICAMGQSLGYEVMRAATGEAGQRLIDQFTFDLVMTDLALPDISGLDVARYVQQRHPRLPILLVTGWSTKMTAEEQRAAGIWEVLYKPFQIEQLTALVQRVINRPTAV